MHAHEVTVGRLTLHAPVMNAAGPWASSAAQLQKLHKTNAGAVVTKTFTLEPSTGNKQPNQYFGDGFAINSVGLANKGADYFLAAAQRIRKQKPLVASIFEPDINRLITLAGRVSRGNFDAIELNLSCPNVVGKEPVAYDPEQLDQLLTRLLPEVDIPVGVKLPPYATRSQVAATARVLLRHPVNHVVLINTYPLAMAVAGGKSAIRPNGGIGGLSGSYLRPIALAHVVLFKKYAPSLPIIAVGGIQNRGDMQDFLQAGASAVQLGAVLKLRGVDVLNELSAPK